METTDVNDYIQLPALPYPDKDPSWRAKAACLGASTDTFYPGKGENTSKARLICFRCPSRVPCAEFAVRNGLGDGIFGGLSHRDRKDVRTGRRTIDIPLSTVLTCAFYEINNVYPRESDRKWYRYDSKVLRVVSRTLGMPIDEIQEHLDNADDYFI